MRQRTFSFEILTQIAVIQHPLPDAMALRMSIMISLARVTREVLSARMSMLILRMANDCANINGRRNSPEKRGSESQAMRIPPTG